MSHRQCRQYRHPLALLFLAAFLLTTVSPAGAQGPFACTGVIFGDTSTDGPDPDPNMDGVPNERVPSCILQVPVELQSFSID